MTKLLSLAAGACLENFSVISRESRSDTVGARVAPVALACPRFHNEL